MIRLGLQNSRKKERKDEEKKERRTHELRPPELPASTMPMSTAVAPDMYAGQGLVEAASLARASHNLGVSTTCAMTTAGHSSSTQTGDCDTVHTLITPAVADLTHDLDRDCNYTHLHKQARDRDRVLLRDPCAPVSCSIPRRQQLYDTSSFACHLRVVPPTLCSCPRLACASVCSDRLGSHLGTKPDFVTCCQQTCRAQPN